MIGSHTWPSVEVLLVCMALVIGSVIWADQVYRRLIVADHKQFLQRFVQREADDGLSQISALTREIADRLQQSTLFQSAMNAAGLGEALNRQANADPVSDGRIDLVQLYLYDSSFTLQAHANVGPSPDNAREVYCQALVSQARREAAAQKSGLCRVGFRPFYASMTALQHQGDTVYLLIVVDPLHNLMDVERRLGVPLMFYYSTGEAGYRSPLWRPEQAGEAIIEARVHLPDYLGDNVLTIAAQQDITAELAPVRVISRSLLSAAALIVVVVVISAIYMARYPLRRPLKAIADQLHTARAQHRNMQLPAAASVHPDLRPIVTALQQIDTDLAYLREHHQTSSVVDHLTALPNRVLFKDRLGQLVEGCRRRGERFALVLLDVNGFKGINNALGHEIGDRVLSDIAERLLVTLRASSTVARISEEVVPLYLNAEGMKGSSNSMRMGGDEFALLLPGVKGWEDAMSVAGRIGAALAPPIDIDGQSLVVTASIGVALYPEHGESAETLLTHGYAALSEAKSTGCGTLIYRESHDVHFAQHLSLQAELSSAIHCDQLRVVYQPKVALADPRVIAVEALVRWAHPRHGIMLPEQFLSLAEQRGLIQPLTDCVLHQALAQFKVWRAQGIVWPVAVNISSRILYDSHLPDKLKRMLDDYEVPASALMLDINEQAIIVDPHRALTVMNRLNEMEIAIAIDDFGTGYSSLGFLKNLPVQELKIDKTFVMDMARAGNDANIVHATIDLAHNLGLKAVAEGVDDDKALAMLKSLKCDYGQGFAICPPMMPEALVDWHAQSDFAGEHA